MFLKRNMDLYQELTNQKHRVHFTLVLRGKRVINTGR
jgi:hypothetical protein